MKCDHSFLFVASAESKKKLEWNNVFFNAKFKTVLKL